MAGRWLFTKEQLSKTPSIKHGYSEEMEGAYRTNCANLIQNMGQRLQLYPFHNENFEPFKLEKTKNWWRKRKENKKEKIEYIMKKWKCWSFSAFSVIAQVLQNSFVQAASSHLPLFRLSHHLHLLWPSFFYWLYVGHHHQQYDSMRTVEWLYSLLDVVS